MPPGVLPADQRLNWEELTTALRTSGFNGTASVLPDPSGDVDASAAISNEFIRRAFSGQTAVR